LERSNDGLFQQYLVPLAMPPKRGLKATEHLMRKAFDWFDERIGKAYKTGEELAQFIAQLSDKLLFAEKTLKTTQSRNRQIARYSLFGLEAHRSAVDYDFESDRYNVEHVLPENPGAKLNLVAHVGPVGQVEEEVFEGHNQFVYSTFIVVSPAPGWPR
jgi:hypothetical protein